MSARADLPADDYYALLGVATNAGREEIRRAYRTRARHLHPDVNDAPDAAVQFAVLARAYDTLSDPTRRRAYDDSRRMNHGRATWSGGGVPDPGQTAWQGRTGGPRPAVEPSIRGLDVHQTVLLTLREAAFGTRKTVTVSRHEVCLTCHGSGAAPGATARQCARCHGTGRGQHRNAECSRCHGNGAIPSVACPACTGKGRVASNPAFPLRFPPALDNGVELRIKNEGDPGPRGGPRGDLRLHIAVEPDPVLRRSGSEVYTEMYVTPEQMVQRDIVEVPTLRGTHRLRLPRNLADGATITLHRQGLRLKGEWRRGDQHVTVHVRGREHGPGGDLPAEDRES